MRSVQDEMRKAMLEANALTQCIKNHERRVSRTKLGAQIATDDHKVGVHWHSR